MARSFQRACMRLLAAVMADQGAERAGRPFSRLPSPELGAPTEAFALAMRDADRMAARLQAEAAQDGR